MKTYILYNMLIGKANWFNILYINRHLFCCIIFFPVQVVDLPTIIEGQKTIDNKTVYKTADICQVKIIANIKLVSAY